MAIRINYREVAPEGLQSVIGVSRYVANTSLDANLRHLVELRVSQINGCVYCCDFHSQQLRSGGESQQRLDVLPAWEEAPFFTERERAALAWADAVTLVSQTHVPDNVYELTRAHFDEKELVDLTIVIANMNALNRISISFRAEPSLRP